jgi:hypothetical protein
MHGKFALPSSSRYPLPRAARYSLGLSNEPPPSTDKPDAAPPPAAANAGGDAGQDKGGGEGAEVRMSTAALSKIKDDQAAKGVRDFLEQLGIKDPAVLKTSLEKLAQLEAANKTDEQKKAEVEAEREKALAAEREKATKAEQAVAAAQVALVAERRSNAIMRAAGEVNHPDDVVGWAERPENAELLAKTMTADGKPDKAGIDALLKACEEARPEWFKKRGGVGMPSHAGAKPPKSNKQEKERVIPRRSY